MGKRGKSFFDYVVNNKNRPPVHNDFSKEKWQGAFSSRADVSEDDTYLYTSGLYIYEKSKRIYQQLDSHIQGLSKNQLRSTICAFSNQQLRVLNEKSDEIIESQIHASGNINILSASNTTFNMLSGLNKANLDQALASLIDSVAEMLKLNRDDINNSGTSLSIPVFKQISYLAQEFLFLRHIWQLCLWKRWRIVEIGGKTYACPPNVDDLLSERAAFHYYENRVYSTTMLATQAIMKNLYQLNPFIEVSQLTVENNEVTNYQLTSMTPSAENIPYNLIEELMWDQLYFKDFKTTLFAKTQGLTLEKMQVVWPLIRSFCRALSEYTFKVNHDPYNIDNYSPLIKKALLVNLLVEVGIDRKDALEALNFLMLSSEKNIWAHPFIPFDDEAFKVILGPVLNGNMLRTYELWLKAGKVEVQEKGFSYEDEVRSSLIDNLLKSKIIRGGYVHEKSIVLKKEKRGERDEEIDLVFSIGNKIFIGEVVCCLFPSEPIENYYYEKRLDHKYDQVVRKVEAARRRTAQLRTLLNRKIDVDKMEVLPIVVSNLALCLSKCRKGVPFIDLESLAGYLYSGSLQHINYEDSGEQITKEEFSYKNDLEAGNNLTSFCLNNPLVLIFKSRLKPSFQQLINIQSKDVYLNYYQLNLEEPEKQ